MMYIMLYIMYSHTYPFDQLFPFLVTALKDLFLWALQFEPSYAVFYSEKKKCPHLRFSEFFKKFLMQMNKNLDKTLIRNKTFYGKLAFFNSFFLASFPVKYNFRIRMHDILSILFSTNKKYYSSTILSFLKNIVS